MNEPEPVYLGSFRPMKAGDILDRYIDISEELSEVTGPAEGTTFVTEIGESEGAPVAVFGALIPLAAGTYQVAGTITVPEDLGSIETVSASAVLAEGEIIQAATFTVTPEGSEEPVANSVAENSVTIAGGRVDFQITAPADAGTYRLTAVFTVSDGQRISKTATFEVV